MKVSVTIKEINFVLNIKEIKIFSKYIPLNSWKVSTFGMYYLVKHTVMLSIYCALRFVQFVLYIYIHAGY